ncbi:MAG: sigma 54-interacting transcriptional regulator [Myxococcales bacterium]|nr:sigma 54-interacting transcriptional regulator [Myxococcales bacterium]
MASQVLPLWKEEAQGASGREAELSTLLREHEEARSSGKARFVFVRGPAGVGKSHLFRLFRAAASARGTDVFEAESPRDSRRPFGLFSQILSELIEHLEHSGVPDAKLASLGRAVGPALGKAATPQGALEESRLALHDSACELFSLSGRSQPIFLFPDLDAADRASLDLFRYLAAVSTAPESTAAGLFVASFRDDEALPPALSEVVSKVSARSLPLAGLDTEGIRAYLSRAEVAERLLEVTGGNPDAIEQLFERPEGRPAELFLRRVERLGERGKRVLSVLAASRGTLSAEAVALTLARLDGTFGGETSAAELDDLVRAHLVTVRMAGGRPVYRFQREPEKHAFLGALPQKELLRVKAALGEALRASGDLLAASELLLEVDPAGHGAHVAVSAADALSSTGAHEDAGELYTRALPYLGKPERARVLGRLSSIAAAQGDFRQALRQLLRTRRESPLGNEEAFKLANEVARLCIRMGRLGLAERALRAASIDDAGKAAAAANLAELRLLRGQPDEAIAIALAALPSLFGQPERAIALRNVLGKACLLKGEHARALEAFAENHEVAQAAGLPHLAAMAMLNQGVAAHKSGDRDRAVRCYQASTHGHRPAQAQALANLGSIYADSGDFELALDHLSRALQAFSRFCGAREVAHVASNLARLYHFLGELDRSIELSEHALGLSREIGERYLQGSALLNLGAALIDKRECLEAAKLLDEARTRFEEVGNEGYAALAAALKARSHLCAGERAQASTELSRRVLEKGCSQLSAAAVEAELSRADLSLSLGDLHGAGRAASRAREALLGKPDLEGPYRVYFLMGKLRLAAGDTAGAQAEMARAARLLDELTQRVAAPRRTQFLSVPKRAEVLSAVEPELRLPKLAAQPIPRASHGLVGRSPSLTRITRQLEPIARSNSTVLIRGESGTGKELLAEAIHQLSPRQGMPLVPVNCAAMVEELLLSELFGHEKGAFTGAVRERKGRFELADAGTLFLDEIGDISPKCQVALLRVLQEREFERVGGTKTLKVDVRVICATNRDLEALIAQGRFRQDLYYRLKGVMLELPPLRDRLLDLPSLAAHFLERIGRERHEAPKQLSQQALELLSRHNWPGNVRELENVLASAAIFADGALITPEAFAHVAELASLMAGAPPTPSPLPLPPAPEAKPPEEPPPPGQGPFDYYRSARERGMSLKDLRREVEIQCIRKALLDAGGNISEAARLLRMKRSRLSQIVNAEPELKGVAHGE